MNRGDSASPATRARPGIIPALLHHRCGLSGLIITVSFTLIAGFAYRLAPYDPNQMHDRLTLRGPSGTFRLGTDEFGRDILSRILVGSRISIVTGLAASTMAALGGTAIGLAVGYAEGVVDAVSMRVFDAVLAFPVILLVIVITAVLGPGQINAILAIAIVNVPLFVRLARATTLEEKWKDYVEAARAAGASWRHILIRAILPNVRSMVLVQMTVSAADAVLLEAALSFLGLGTPPPAPSWGQMLSTARGYLWAAPWYGIFPGVAVALLVLGLYLLGDGLADVLDPLRS